MQQPRAKPLSKSEQNTLFITGDKDLFKQSYRTYSDHDVIVGVF